MEGTKAKTVKGMQEVVFAILCDIDDFCRNNHIRYYLSGGTCLGAIRHKGFIPWDDDMDIMMPRPDYERFINYCEENKTGFSLITYQNEKDYNGLFAKIWNPSTEIIDSIIEIKHPFGVSIDVFPLEGLGQSKEEALKIFRKTSWNRELLNATGWKKYFRSKTHSIWTEPIRFVMFILSRFADPKSLISKIDKVNLSHSFESSSYAGCVCGSYREQEIMKKDTFEHYIDLPFEGHHFKVIQNYHEYLTKHYGDYMKLPPKEKQETHHTYKAYIK